MDYTMRQARDIIEDSVVNPLGNGQHRTIYLVGDPGIGKTSLARSVFMAHRKWDDHSLPLKDRKVINPNGFTHFIAYVAPEREPIDWGLPSVNKARDAFSMLPLDEFKFLPTDRPFILIDEVDKAPNMMQNLIARIANDRTVGNIVFPEGTFILMAGNKLTNKAGGFVANTHIKNRRTNVPLMVSPEEWIDDVAIPFELHSSVVSFIRVANDMLHKFDAGAPSFPSPRSVTKVGLMLNQTKSPHVERALIEGDCGVEWANSFWGHLRIFRSLRNPEMVIADPDNIEVPDGNDSMPILFAETTHLAKYVNRKNADAIFRYFNRLPGEFGFIGYRDVLKRDRLLVSGSPSGQRWLVKNATMIAATEAPAKD